MVATSHPETSGGGTLQYAKPAKQGSSIDEKEIRMLIN
jgi:hypothetical protein